MFKIGEIRELIRLLDETSVSELRVESEGMKLAIKKYGSGATVVSPPATTFDVSRTLPPLAEGGQTAAQTTVAGEVSDAETEQGVHIVTSPMVGTFYRSPSPDAPAYVEAGSKVTVKSVLCIVEAMKLMNEIEAEVAGEVVEVLAENGQLVEYGQPLVKIRLS